MHTAKVFGREVLPPTQVGATPFWRLVLRGLGQLGFQDNEISGVLFVVGVALYGAIRDQWQQVAFMLIGALIGTAVAKLMRGNAVTLDLGLLAFNSILMGLALGNFYETNAALWVAVVVMSAVSGVVAVLTDKYVPFPVLAVPFIVPFWILWPFAEDLGLVKLVFPPWDTGGDVFFFQSALAALGSTLFAGIIVVGVVYAVAVAVSNWRHAVIAFFAALAGHFVAVLGGAPSGSVNAGFYGFNAVLAALAVYVLCGEDLRLALFAAVGATVLMQFVIETGLQPLASGFVLITWVIMLLAWFQPRFWNPRTDGTAPPA